MSLYCRTQSARSMIASRPLTVCALYAQRIRASLSPITARLWDPILRLAEKIGLKMPQLEQNALTTGDIENLLQLSGYEVIKREWRQLIPCYLLGMGTLVNRFIAPLPVIRRACLHNYASPG